MEDKKTQQQYSKLYRQYKDSDGFLFILLEILKLYTSHDYIY